ncbi:Major facilitator, sugar transporter-like [Dillenia turbinata]|uniref:Major facilitator, sugar transporter-like n=1 Tax=Dillenia turbinata TaxID=194707 RepID=A0AAN8ZIQ1_9MAGN
MAVCAIFNGLSNATNDHTPEEADLVWRLILILGAIPAGLTYYWRIMMPETARYTALVEQNIRKAVKDMEKVFEIPMDQMIQDLKGLPSTQSYPLFSMQFLRHHGINLCACAMSWFLVDVVYYSSNLFQSHIYKRLLPDPREVNAYQEAYEVAKLQAIIAICSTIPGYWATVFLMDHVGRVKIQALGFFFMATCLLAIGLPYATYWNTHSGFGFIFLYGLTFCFSNFGPNTTTFIVPAELFPARFRSTSHGISGAVGKVGAIVGAVGFLWASDCKGDAKEMEMTASLVTLALVCILGMLLTLSFTPETMGRSLEENEKE